MEQEFAEGIDSWETMMFLYNSALKEVNTKLEILNDEFVHIHNYNPIEYIKSRIKTPESIVKKLKKGGYENSLGVHIRHLREKLEAEPGAPQFLRTVRGIGYKLTKGEEA